VAAPALSASAVVTTNYAPVADDSGAATDQETPVPIVLHASDDDADPLVYAITAGPAHGVLEGAPPDLVYRPDWGYSGPDEIAFSVSDGLAAPVAGKVTVTVRPRVSDLIFEDGFESGTLGAWSSMSSDGIHLRAAAEAALGGSAYGLAAAMTPPVPMFVQDDRPAGDKRMRVHFAFDPNGFDPGEGDGHFRVRLFVAFDPAGKRVLAVVLRRRHGTYALQARVRLDAGPLVETAFVPIPDAPHEVGLLWSAASAALADGSLELFVDGQSQQRLDGLSIGASGVESERLGALAVKAGATGTLFFDDFESRGQVVGEGAAVRGRSSPP
jgi:hypothetical protein